MNQPTSLFSKIQTWVQEQGFAQAGLSSVDLSSAEPGLLSWLDAGFHGEMHYMAAHGMKRARPAELVPGTLSIITVRADYLPQNTPEDWVEREKQRWHRAHEGIVSLYARKRDYHKVLRNRLQKIGEKIQQAVQQNNAQRNPAVMFRVFTDSAPVLEVELGTRSAQGWRGKHTLLLNRQAGSMFFLGEIFLNLSPAELGVSAAQSDASSGMASAQSAANDHHCGSCMACLQVCPTQAIVAPYRLDARRCISYLTIEHDGPIPIELRPLMGNRIYGCDDCQLVCPWNKFAQRSPLPDFDERGEWTHLNLSELLRWDEATFLQRTTGTPIRRIGHLRWLRNVAVAAGNALASATLPPALRQTLLEALHPLTQHTDDLVREHAQWASTQNTSQA